jgi:hypothetical protein
MKKRLKYYPIQYNYEVDNEMKNKFKTLYSNIKKTLMIITILYCSFLIVANIFIIQKSTATEGESEWSLTLNITETNGLKDHVTLGEKDIASNEKDNYDMPKPPTPQQPYIRAWFKTNLDPPHNELWEEYREYPNNYNVWNFTVMWAPENDTSTSVTISWDTSQVTDNKYNSIHLYSNDDLLADMITENSYTYTNTANTANNFEVICQSEITPNGSTNEINLTLLVLVGIIIIIIVVVALLLWRKK